MSEVYIVRNQEDLTEGRGGQKMVAICTTWLGALKVLLDQDTVMGVGQRGTDGSILVAPTDRLFKDTDTKVYWGRDLGQRPPAGKK